MEYYKNILCVKASWLTDNKILTKHQYYHMSKRGQLRVIRRGCRNTPALVSYESLPERYKHSVRGVRVILPKRRKDRLSRKDRTQTERLRPILTNTSYLTGVTPKETRAEYYANAVVLELIGRLLTDKVQMRRSRGGKINTTGKKLPKEFRNLTERNIRTLFRLITED